MDEIEKRLRESADACFASYETWRKDQKNTDARETLQEAIHELRKVASRLEIELAISERNEMAQRPIPIPPHRDARTRGGEGEGEDRQPQHFSDNENIGQGHGGGQNKGAAMRRRMHRRPEGGGGGGGGNKAPGA